MTDQAIPPENLVAKQKRATNTKRRFAAENRFKFLGLGAVLLAMSFLLLLLSTVVYQAMPAFTYNYLKVPVDFSNVNPEEPRKADYGASYKSGLYSTLPFASGRKNKKIVRSLVSSGSPVILRNAMLDDPSSVSSQTEFWLPVSDFVDLYLKELVAVSQITKPPFDLKTSVDEKTVLFEVADAGLFTEMAKSSGLEPGPEIALTAKTPSLLVEIDGGTVKLNRIAGNQAFGTLIAPFKSTQAVKSGAWQLRIISQPESSRKFSDKELVLVEVLREQGRIETRWNSIFFSKGASREPEMAGIWGAVVGSFLTMVVTLLIAFPLGVSAAVYLEEFAPKNAITDLIEVNINNLAAVPSIVFGLLGLAVFLNWFEMPRSAPIVGGIVLALMTLPTIIIASRAALKAVPPSIREAALGIGASRMQTIFHHVLPLAMPGIFTGTIIGMAQALGETAPLLMIGMVAFIVDIPGGITDPATVLPVQIFMWADFPEPGFQQKTAAAILILLAFLVLMNLIAVMLRKRFERRW